MSNKTINDMIPTLVKWPFTISGIEYYQKIQCYSLFLIWYRIVVNYHTYVGTLPLFQWCLSSYFTRRRMVHIFHCGTSLLSLS